MAKQIKKHQNKAVDIEQKKLLEQQERQELVFGADALLPKKSVDKELEIFQLRGGLEFTIKGVKDIISELARPYFPMFPNSKPFFKLMYKLNGWDNLNPNDFIKPPCIALWIKQYIYGRFSKEVLPTLLQKDNPFLDGYIKRYKLFQFLNDEGLLLLEGYIKDAIKVMETAKDWYDFELKYTALYKLSVQLKIFVGK
jgi:hypothetical protein